MTALPRHVAVIMDGNGRWASERRLPRLAGHRAGVEATRRMIETVGRRGVEVLSLFVFSTENWQRPTSEVQHLMALFLRNLQVRGIEQLRRNGIRLRIIGDTAQLSPAMRRQIAQAESLTADNTAMTLAVAVNYGGRWDIAQAACRLAREAVAGNMDEAQICPERFASYLCLSDLPPVDLLIRTGGELRISNFLLWQAAYAELFFEKTLWPDFDERRLDDILRDFAMRKRRFGRVGSAA